MLRQLSIHHVALIDELDIVFYDGFSVLTGETGAGKSIIIEALNFVLGERASRELIQSGAQKASVEAAFALDEGEAVLDVLSEMELLPEDDTLVLYRELSAAGKGVCRCNGTLVSTAMLKRIGDALIDIHGQHAHQSLLNPKLHLPMLDAFGGEELLSARREVAEAYKAAADAGRSLRAADIDERERERRCDLLSYQIKEIDDAKLVADEEEALLEQRRVLINAQTIMDALEHSAEALTGDEMSVMHVLSGVTHTMDSIAGLHRDYAEASEKLTNAYYELEDAAFAIRDLRSAFTFDAETLDGIEWRLDTISTLKKKYGADIAEVLSYRQRIGEEYELLVTSEERREKLKLAYDAAITAYAAAAGRLSALRREAAQKLSAQLLPQMRDLGMAHASFSVAFARLAGDAPGANGYDDVEFLLSANAGEPEKPLSRVASGGELSRIMLSFKSVLADSDGIPTMVFDEIDTGISGQMGFAVAKKMRQIAGRHQVLCVTHLPQIAAFANRHYHVYKETDGEATHCSAVLLDEEDRAAEIARIMGASPNDAVAMQHARQLIASANDAAQG